MWHKEHVEIIKHSWDFFGNTGCILIDQWFKMQIFVVDQHRHTEDTSSFLQRNNMRRVLGLHS